jgi:outer membrane receptor protein involved in Fe transport
LLTTYSYTGERYPDIGNFDATKMRGYGRWDIRANWVSDSGKWAAGLFAQNVLDEIGLVEFLPLNTNDGTSMGTLTESRRIGAFVRWSLN